LPPAENDGFAATMNALPVFGFVCRHEHPLADGVEREVEWMEHAAASGHACAYLWQGAQGFVVPRSYQRAPHWEVARAQAAGAGWPVQVRGSGGGLVPQGPGVLNLSLVWPVAGAAAPDLDAVYRALCGELAAALARLGLRCDARAVTGAFCDGRYNLACGDAKLAGTAQCWRRIGGVQVVLAHALLLVDADPAALTERCNGFEAALGRAQRYRSEAVTTVAAAWRSAHAGAAVPADLAAQVAQAIAERFARVLPPRVHDTAEQVTEEEQPWS
jgi:lipoate-protein ligase A